MSPPATPLTPAPAPAPREVQILQGIIEASTGVSITVMACRYWAGDMFGVLVLSPLAGLLAAGAIHEIPPLGLYLPVAILAHTLMTWPSAAAEP